MTRSPGSLSDPPTDTPAAPRSFRAQAAVLGVVCLVAYLSNARHVGQIDGRATPRMALSLLREGDLDLDEFPDYCRDGLTARPKYVVQVGEHTFSKWSPGAAVCYAPFFAIPAWTGMQPMIPDDRDPSRLKANKQMLWVAKIAAAAMTALTAVVVLAALRRICRPRPALLLTLLYAFGTTAWPINAQDTWQHGPGALMVALGLLGILRCERRADRFGAAVGAALALGVAVAVRPTNGALAVPLGVLLLARSRPRFWPAAIAAGLLPVLALLLYNQWTFGVALGGGYAAAYEGSPWTTPIHLGAAGLLVSPSRGLLIFTPAMLLVPYGAWRGLCEAGRRLPAAMLALGCAMHLALMSLWSGWFGGWSYGPRFLAEAMPAAVALLAFGADRIWERIGWRTVLIVLVVVSVLIASLGCYIGVDDWHKRQEDVRRQPLGQAVWEWDECLILYQVQKLLGLADLPEDAATRSAGARAGS